MKQLCICLSTVFMLNACGGADDKVERELDNLADSFSQTPDIEPINAALKTMLPLALSASLAHKAVHGESISGVSTSNTCSDYPCPALVSFALNEQMFPLDINLSAELTVAGLWSSPSTAVLTLLVDEGQIGSDEFSIDSFTTFPMEIEAGVLRVAYGGIDISVAGEDVFELTSSQVDSELERLQEEISQDPEVVVNMDAWFVEYRDNGSTNFLDDQYYLSGGGQYIQAGSSAEILQLGLIDAEINSECALNPVQGISILQEISAGNSSVKLGQALMEFDGDCNGTIQVGLATGSFLLLTGDEVALEL